MSHRGIEDIEKHYSSDGQCIVEEGAGQQGTVPVKTFSISSRRYITPHKIELSTHINSMRWST